MQGLHGSKLLNSIVNNFWYGPYTAGDFAVKSRMMIAVMSNYRLINGEFLNKEQFILKYYQGKRSAGNKAFDDISETLYGSFEINEDGLLAPKAHYKDVISDQVLNNLATITNNLGRKLDGTLTGSEKSRIHADAFGAAL